MGINYDRDGAATYSGAKLTFVKRVNYDEFLPEWPNPKSLGEDDLFGSVEIHLPDDDLNRLKRVINRCRSELRIGLVLIMNRENWKSLMKGHHNNMLLSMTFEDVTDFDKIDEGEPIQMVFEDD